MLQVSISPALSLPPSLPPSSLSLCITAGVQEAISAYAEIVETSPVRIAGGEGSDTVRMAEVSACMRARVRASAAYVCVCVCVTAGICVLGFH